MNLPNSFAGIAVQTAYNECEEWLDELLEYLKGNLEFLKYFIKTKIPEVKVIDPEGTYLVWLDFREIEPDPEKLQNLLLKEAKVAFNIGNVFRTGGAGFERVNIACPRATLNTALNQVAVALRNCRNGTD